MQETTDKWLDAFNREVKTVAAMFDSMLLPGKLEDYYEVKEQDGILNIILSSVNVLPNPVADALYDALVKSSPQKPN